MANYDLISIGSNEQDLMLKMVDIKSLDDLFDAIPCQPCAGLCWLLTSSARIRGFLGRNFVRRFSFSLQVGIGLSFEYALETFG